jgi:hypothetical protein
MDQSENTRGVLHDGYVYVAEGSDASIRMAHPEGNGVDNGGIASSSSEISRNSAAFSTAWFLCMFSGRLSVIVESIRGHEDPPDNSSEISPRPRAPLGPYPQFRQSQPHSTSDSLRLSPEHAEDEPSRTSIRPQKFLAAPGSCIVSESWAAICESSRNGFGSRATSTPLLFSVHQGI